MIRIAMSGSVARVACQWDADHNHTSHYTSKNYTIYTCSMQICSTMISLALHVTSRL